MAISTNPGATMFVSFQATDKDETLTVTGKIYQDGSQVGSDITLSHVADGMYEGSVSAPGSEGTFTIVYTTDSAVHETISETISVRHSWRPSFGGGGEAVIPKNILDPMVKGMKLLAEEMMRIEVELAKKSEFNPNRDLVKTIPTSMRPIMDKIDKIPQKIKMPSVIKTDNSDVVKAVQQIKVVDRTNEILSKIKNQTIHVVAEPDPRIVNALVEQNNKIDSLSQRIASTITNAFGAITRRIQPFLNINNAIQTAIKKDEED